MITIFANAPWIDRAIASRAISGERLMKKLMIGLALAILSYLPSVSNAGDNGNDKALIFGAINADGTSQFRTETFRVSHPGTGNYILTFAPDVFGNKYPTCIVTPLGAVSSIGRETEDKDPSVCDIFITNAAGMLMDTVFVFVAGPSTGIFPAAQP
jgi:hypothetical protein